MDDLERLLIIAMNVRDMQGKKTLIYYEALRAAMEKYEPTRGKR